MDQDQITQDVRSETDLGIIITVHLLTLYHTIPIFNDTEIEVF